MGAEGNYQPLSYLTFTHKKESGKDRTLRIPTVRDRVVPQAILLVIQPIFEAEECTRMLLLKFNPEKTSIRHRRDGFSFLGYYFDERGKRPDEPAVKRLGERVGGVLQKAVEYSENQLREKIDSIVRGWLN